MPIVRRYLNAGSFTYGGTGADGALVFDGVSTVAGLVPTANVYRMTGPINATDLTINLGVRVEECNHPVFCTGTASGPGTLDNSGGNGSDGQLAGAFSGGQQGRDSSANAGTVKPLCNNPSASQVGGGGGIGAFNGGGDGGYGTAGNAGGNGGQGGLSGANVGGVGGAGGPFPIYTVPTNIPQLVTDAYNTPSNLDVFTTDAYAGGGGGGGGGASELGTGGLSGFDNGGGGGGRGGAGGWLILFANHVASNLVIKTTGGNGGNGCNGQNAGGFFGGAQAGGGGGGGGGAGGPGGIALVVTSDGDEGTLSIGGGSGGTGGTGGTPVGSHSGQGSSGTGAPGGSQGYAFIVSTGPAPTIVPYAQIIGIGAGAIPIPPPSPATPDCVEDPLIMLRWSNDGGHTFGTELTARLGKAGETDTRIRYNRLGKARDRVYELKVTDAVKVRFISAFLDIDEGTN